MKSLTIAAVPTVAVIALVGLWHFPYATDDPVRREDELQAFYDLAYDTEDTTTVVRGTPEAQAARTAKWGYDIPGRIRAFVKEYSLHDAKVLDVGSGTGYLQDIVDDYTGLDISRTVAQHYHKPFVAGTATAMPFEDDTFDAVWSIWVLEHIPNPEAALNEIRRVVKPGGIVYLMPAWDVQPWFAEGYAVRPYGDFGLGGRLLKASIPLRSSRAFLFLSTVPNRTVRSFASWGGPTRLHYRRLVPNYTDYWQADSDAVNSLDRIEMAMWFHSRGDACLNCVTGAWRFFQPNRDTALIIRVSR